MSGPARAEPGGGPGHCRDMSRTWTLIVLMAALAVIAGLGGWTLYVSSRLGYGWDGLGQVLIFVVAGLIAVGGLTGGLMWLAFYSARHGYDEPYDINKPGGGRPR